MSTHPTVGDSTNLLLKKLVTATQGISGGSSLPTQAGHNGEFLTTDGATASWAGVVGGATTATRQTATNNAGDTTLTAIAASVIQHTAVVTVGGVARTSNIAVPVTNRAAGDRACIKYLIPATANIILVTKNSTTGGTTLFSFTSDTSGADLTVELEFDGAAWQMLRWNAPIA